MSAKADLTKEPVIEPGTEVTVPCDICTDGVGKFDCWRCEGKGETVVVTEPEHCPVCGLDWTGDQIAREHMSAYGATHFSRRIGIYRFDRTVAYKCPDCGIYVSRFDPGKILTEEQVMRGSLRELMGR